VWRAIVKLLRSVIATKRRQSEASTAIATFTLAVDKSCDNVRNSIENSISKHYEMLDQYLSENGLLNDSNIHGVKNKFLGEPRVSSATVTSNISQRKSSTNPSHTKNVNKMPENSTQENLDESELWNLSSESDEN